MKKFHRRLDFFFFFKIEDTKEVVKQLFKKKKKKNDIVEIINKRSDTLNLTYNKVKRILHELATINSPKEEKITPK